MSNTNTNVSAPAVDVPMEIDAKLMQLGYAVHVDAKGKQNPSVRTKMHGENRAVVSWDRNLPKLLGREVGLRERIRGAVFIMTPDGDIVQDYQFIPVELQEYMVFADKYIADNNLLDREVDVRPKNGSAPETKAAGPAPGAQQMDSGAKSGTISEASGSMPQTAKNGATNLPATRNNMQSIQAQESKPAVAKDFMSKIETNGKDVPEELAINLGGKRYATKNGRWYALHMSGRKLRSSKVEVIHWSFHDKMDDPMAGIAVCKATIIIENGTPEGELYEGIGVAHQGNTNKMIHNNLDHMAETRAKNRALGDAIAGGWYTGNNSPVYDTSFEGSCSAEEMGDFDGNVYDVGGN